MLKKYYLYCIVAVLAAAFIAACSGGEEVDPYALVTLRQAIHGKVISKGFKYRFKNPQIAELHDHLGIIREGNLLEFISGRSLEDRLEDMTGDFELCVVKEYSPFVHFRVEKIYTETDTVFISQAGAISYPQIYDAEDFNMGDFPEIDVDRFAYNRTSFLKNQEQKSFRTACRVAMEEEEGQRFFVLQGDDSKLRVADPSDGVGVILKMLIEGNYPFEGGFTFAEMEESFPYRQRTRIVGTVDVNFVKYGKRIISS